MGLLEGIFSDQFTIARLDRIERKLDLIIQHLGIADAERDTVLTKVLDLAKDPKKKIQAIKRYRELTGAGLAEAKAAVEAMAR
ncbi:MAG: ribosomal protein L7/L12 [Planctomycetota bacterium]